MELSGRFIEKNRELFELCQSLRKVALESSGGTAAVPTLDEKALRREMVWRRTLHAFSAKADRTFCAALILCSDGFTEDAVMLTRSLLELDVCLRYVSLDPQPRVMEMIYESEREYKKELEGMAKVRGLDTELKQALDEVNARLSEIERDCEIEPRKWKKTTMWKKATVAALEDHYFVFQKWSGLVHADPNKLIPYIRLDETSGDSFAVDSTPKGKDLEKVLVSAAAYFADIFVLRNERFGWETSALLKAHAQLKDHYMQTKYTAKQ